MKRRVRKLWPSGERGWGGGTSALLTIGALLIVLVGCSRTASQPPAASNGASPSANQSRAAGQSVPPPKMSPNTPQIVRAPAAQPYTGGPRLAVDEASFDYGKVKLGDTVETAFHLKNAGDAPLTLTGEPLVRAVEGC